MNQRLFLLFTLIIPLLFGGGGVLFGLSLVGKGPLTQPADVVIEPHTGLLQTAAALKNANVIGNEYEFAALIAVTGNKNKIKAGEYEFTPQISLWHVVQKFARGEILVRKITFPEGWTSKQIVSALNQNTFLMGDVTEIPAEGTLMPDTYTFTRGDKREEILSRMKKKMADFIAATWPRRAADYPLKTTDDWLKLASIIEAETPKSEERARVAAVYLNRLAKPMRLEADPTVAYGASDGSGNLGRALTLADLQTANPYNTYLNDGLPPTPINNPGRASLLAALTPEKNDYLYFVANGLGGHNFAATYEAHQKNVIAWRKIKNETKPALPATAGQR